MIFIVVILAFLIPFGLFYFLGKVDSSFDNAIKNNDTLPDNGRYVKVALVTALIYYGLLLGGFLIGNAGAKRGISIESRKNYGSVVVKQIKYQTYFRTTQAQIIYQINNPAEYLFLNCGDLQICYADALLRLAIVIMVAIFVWWFNFDGPFQWKYYRSARRIWGLIFITVWVKVGASWYSNQWAGDHFDHIDAPHYKNNNDHSYLTVMIFIIAISSLFYLYRQGVKNKEEIDLTV